MSASCNPVATVNRIAKTSADFASTADKHCMVRVAQSLLEHHAGELREVGAAMLELIEAAAEVSRIQIVRPNDLGRAKQARLRAAIARVGGAA